MIVKGDTLSGGCDCLSYNRPDWGGSDLEAVLPSPPHLMDIKPGHICIDACLVPVIKKLWDHQVVTLSSCCGHRREAPNIVLGDDVDADMVRQLANTVDERHIKLLQWRLVEV